MSKGEKVHTASHVTAWVWLCHCIVREWSLGTNNSTQQAINAEVVFFNLYFFDFSIQNLILYHVISRKEKVASGGGTAHQKEH
jgi:hypothetical protein